MWLIRARHFFTPPSDLLQRCCLTCSVTPVLCVYLRSVYVSFKILRSGHHLQHGILDVGGSMRSHWIMWTQNTAETIIFSPPVNSVHHPNYINFVNGICQHFYNIVIFLRLFQILSANEVEDGLGCGEGYHLAIQSTTIMTSTVVCRHQT